jgi:chromosome partitioning protein
MRQIIVSVLAKAGGVGKTSTAVNVAYELAASYGVKTALIALDSNCSLADFVQLSKRDEAGELIDRVHSSAAIFDRGFQGDWPLQTTWALKNLEVCQCHPELAGIAENLGQRRRADYILRDQLRKYPLDHTVVLLDCPGTSDSRVVVNALAASTHVLIPLQLEVKIKTLTELVEWVDQTSEELELSPMPEILGLVPNRYNKRWKMHQDYLGQLPGVAESLDLNIYPPIPESAHIANACDAGLPLGQYRPGEACRKIYKQVARDLKEQCENA